MQRSLTSHRAAFTVALALFMALAAPALTQEGPPLIRNYQIELTEVGGRTGLTFTWQVENVDRVRLLNDGREIEARIQLPDGSFGWPPEMPGAFRTSGTDGVYALVAENPLGRVEARGSYREHSCYAWLVPPGTHWTRCRRGGVVASNLATTVAPGPMLCDVVGHVTSTRNFRVAVQDNPLNPASGTTTFELNSIWFRRAGQEDFRRARLSGRGNERTYRLNNLSGGHDYEITLGWNWPSNPSIVRVRCPDRPGTHRITAPTLHNYDFRYEY
jgi:hypothetical protein